ncbi:hypothetical protein ACFL1R_10570 [Candidatus Latescibacterota bacterium]
MSKDGKADDRKKVAAVVTVYTYNTHADVFIGRMLEGSDYYGKRSKSPIKIVSMYTNQVPENDLSRNVAAKHSITIYPTVREALTIGGKDLAVEGVVLIGEHGKYAWNIKEQHLYPRYWLYKQIIDVFRETGHSVPVYTDKYFSYNWDEAKWMHNQSIELGFPLMAGSSLSVAWRRPHLELDMGTPIEKAVVSWYGGIESYGFHGLEGLQCMVERRKEGETGIAAVQLIEGSPVWSWTDANPWASQLLDASLETIPNRKSGSVRSNVSNPVVFIIEYNSGLEAAVYLLNGHITSFGFAADITGSTKPVATEFKTAMYKPHDHAYRLIYHIERMIAYGVTPYPVERTLLTTGALIAGMDSRYQGHIRLETPHLNITYQAHVDSGYYRTKSP